MAERVLVGAGVIAGSGVVIARAVVKKPSSTAILSTAPGERVSFGGIKELLDLMRSELAIQIETQSGDSAEILSAMSMILSDPELHQSIKDRLAEGADGATAIRGALTHYARALEALGGYFAQRSSDLIALADQAVDRLMGQTGAIETIEPSILVSQRLAPIEIASMDSSMVVGFITAEGGISSHTAVMARANSIPAVLGVVGIGVIRNGDLLLLDATSGQIFVNPTEEEVLNYKNAIATEVDLSAVAPVPLLANIGSALEGKAALAAGAEGVGLYRAELMFLGRSVAPSLEEQVFEYSRLLARFRGKRVVARLLDLDFDKPLPFLIPAGEGKYFGRGLATLLANPIVLKTQLQAFAQAASYYPETELWVMAPMVVTVSEARQFVAMGREAGLMTLGAMVEVPELTEESVLAELVTVVDFLSIGTNDLSQYTLNRPRSEYSTLSDAKHPDVVSQIARVIDFGQRAGIPVNICGEIAGEPEAASWFIEMGVSAISAASALLPALRQKLAIRS